jgi:hypothetical protein
MTVKEGDGRMRIGATGTAGIGQGIVGAQQGILGRVDRKKFDVVLFVVPDRIGWWVGGLGGEGHAKSEGGGLLCGSWCNGRETRGR